MASHSFSQLPDLTLNISLNSLGLIELILIGRVIIALTVVTRHHLRASHPMAVPAFTLFIDLTFSEVMLFT